MLEVTFWVATPPSQSDFRASECAGDPSTGVSECPLNRSSSKMSSARKKEPMPSPPMTEPVDRAAGFLLEELRRIRQSRGLSLDRVARSAGFSQTEISRWERGRHVPNVLNFQAVINALGYEVRLVRLDEAAE